MRPSCWSQQITHATAGFRDCSQPLNARPSTAAPAIVSDWFGAARMALAERKRRLFLVSPTDPILTRAAACHSHHEDED